MLFSMIRGFATEPGTQRFRDRFPDLRERQHFRIPPAPIHALWCSSIGIGTYLGEPNDAQDKSYEDSVRVALSSGINVIDTAINYRHQRSERAIGRAIADLMSKGELHRDEFVVCSKAGYLSFDGAVPSDPAGYFAEEYLSKGIFKKSDVASHMHCLAPTFLDDQLKRSRKNLGVETIDVYYLHNPEVQIAEVPREELRRRIHDAFRTMEHAVSAGQIRYYGMGTWNAFRVGSEEQSFVRLEECAKIAREVGGQDHHLRFIQLPFNLSMPEAFANRIQPLGKKPISLLRAANDLGIAVIGSASLGQSQLTCDLPASIAGKLGMKTDAARALQFARSAPGLLTALVGMGRVSHVFENVTVAESDPISEENWAALFS